MTPSPTSAPSTSTCSATGSSRSACTTAHDDADAARRERGRRRARPSAAGPGEPWEVAAWRVHELRGGDALAVRPFAGSSPYVPLERARCRAAGARRGGVHAAPPGRRRRPRPVPPHLRDVRVRPDVHRGLDAAVGRARGPARGVPGLRPPGDRVPALARARRPLRQRVHRDRPAAGPASASSAPTRRTPGARSGCRSRAGSTSTRRTTACPTHRHVTVAWGRDYGDVAPVRGVVIGPAVDQTLSVEVDVERLTPP